MVSWLHTDSWYYGWVAWGEGAPSSGWGPSLEATNGHLHFPSPCLEGPTRGAGGDEVNAHLGSQMPAFVLILQK